MSEREEAEEFCRALDALLEGREVLGPLERDLARADFSAESRVRASLRARLLRESPPLRRSVALRPRLALSLAALVLVLVLPFSMIWRGAGKLSYPRGSLGLPVLPGQFPAGGAGARPEIFETARGVVSGEGGRRVSWELGGDTFVLESRRIALDEIFARRQL